MLSFSQKYVVDKFGALSVFNYSLDLYVGDIVSIGYVMIMMFDGEVKKGFKFDVIEKFKID